MENLKNDAESRELIIKETGKNLFVEAGAGSGKTTMLVNRMVAMVESKDDIDISKICAITFTKAAASEFYERFQAILMERSSESYDWEDKGYEGQLPKPDEDSRKKCKEALENIDLCFMGTIDSFCNMILSEHPTEAGILSDARLANASEVAELIRKTYVDICNGKYGEELLKKAKRFRSSIYNGEKVFIITVDRLMNMRNANINARKPEDLNISFKDVKKELLDLIDYLMANPELKHAGNQANETAWENLSLYKRTFEKDWNENLSDVTYAFNAFSKIMINRKEYDEHAEHETHLSKFFHLEKEKARKMDFDFSIDFKPSLFRIAMDLALDCIPIVEKQMHDNGLLTYFDYLYYLRNLLKKDASRGGVLIDHIYKRHSYFLIDEFQDTNPLQSEIFFYLSSEKPVEKWDECVPREGSLFIVGDPKQSIYRFRNADVESFRKVKNLFIKNSGTDSILKLTRNFRSKESLCNYFNDVFTSLMPAESQNQSKFEPIPLIADGESEEFKGVYRYDADDKENARKIKEMILYLVNNEKFKVKGKDDKKARPVSYGDFMIITATKPALKDIISMLSGANIPIKVEGSVPFAKCEPLKEVALFLASAADTKDSIAFYKALMGKICGLTKKELHDYKECGGYISLYSHVDDDKLTDSARAVQSKIDMLRLIIDEAKGKTTSALVEQIIDKTDIFNTVDADALEILYYSLELIRDAERNGKIVTWKDGKAYLDDLLAEKTDIERYLSLAEEEDKVHLANLHKVKGLEAPIVILSYAKLREITADCRIAYDSDPAEAYIFEVKENAFTTLLSTDDYPSEHDKEADALEDEEIRKLYVAATRARNALIICASGVSAWTPLGPDMRPDVFGLFEGPVPANKEKDTVSADELYDKAKKECVLSNKVNDASYINMKPSKLDSTSSKMKSGDEVSDEETDSSTDTEENSTDKKEGFATLIGNMVHRLMETIVSNRNTGDIDAIIAETIRMFRTIKSEPYEQRFSDMLHSVATVITSGGYAQTNGVPQDILNTLLNADDVYCEVPFAYKETVNKEDVLWNGVIDVMYREGEDWHIVDYKTNAESTGLDEHYKNQLEAYCKAVEESTGIKVVDAKIYHIDV